MISAMRLIFIALLLIPGLTWAKCPPARDVSDQTAQLLTELVNAKSEEAATRAADGLWKIWHTAPDHTAQELLDFAMARREAYDFEMSENLLDELINYCPTYPEAFNQRAFSRFLRENYDGALEDLDKVLETTPYHFGALSGRALSLLRQGRIALGQKALRRAVRVHPFLRERSMILEEYDDDI